MEVTLQSRNKCQNEYPNLRVGDLVLLRDSQERCNEWPMRLVNQSYPNKDGKVRIVKVKVLKNRDTAMF